MDDVRILRWPQQSGEATALAKSGTPRLLLVEPDADPPVISDWRVDWVRLPADERDVAARVLGLTRRTRPVDPPRVDGHDRLVFSGAWVALSPIEARLAAVLSSRFETVVTLQQLCEHGWDETPKLNALRVHLTRLRRRIGPLGLELRTVRSKGFVLQPSVRNPG
jgi:DNA-binding response OmpR family regulator